MNSIAPDLAAASTIERAAAGDEAAFARIVATHRPEMLRVAYVVTGDWAMAEDAAQAALWKAWHKLGSLRDPDSLRSWMLAVAANEGRSILRVRRRHPVVDLVLADERPAHMADPGDAINAIDLANALHRLDPEDRALVALRYLADLDSGEIARITGRTASGVRTRLARVLGRLRKELEHE